MFLEVIKQIQCITYIKLRSLENESLVRRSEMEKLTFARDQYQKYTSATQTRRDYIASMGYKFSAQNPTSTSPWGQQVISWLTEKVLFRKKDI
jgi:hypothetical protein